MYFSKFHGMLPQLVLTAAILSCLEAACLLSEASNQCPQPTDSNPFPHPFRYGHPDDCTFYFTCVEGNPILMQCQMDFRFNNANGTCVEAFSADDVCSRANAQRECTKWPKALIPHNKSCQGYFNCSDTKPRGPQSFFAPFEKECPYPSLFDVNQLECVHFKVAKCGADRVPAKDACDYLDNMCSGFQCQPCTSRLPSCLEKPDGPNPYPHREWSPWYIQCDTERLMNISVCENHYPTETTGFFSPDKKKCVSQWEVPMSIPHGRAPSCEGKEPGLYLVQESTNVYYQCNLPEVFYCETGSAFNETSQVCETIKAQTEI